MGSLPAGKDPASPPTIGMLVKEAIGKDAGKAGLLMSRKASPRPDLVALPMLAHETLYVGADIGKKAHVAGFVSSTLLTRHQRFEHCPALDA